MDVVAVTSREIGGGAAYCRRGSVLRDISLDEAAVSDVIATESMSVSDRFRVSVDSDITVLDDVATFGRRTLSGSNEIRDTASSFNSRIFMLDRREGVVAQVLMLSPEETDEDGDNLEIKLGHGPT